VHTDDAPSLRVSTQAEGAVTVLRLAGELDLSTSRQLDQRVQTVLRRESGVRRLVVDIGGLEFLDVAGLTALLDASDRIHAAGGTLALRRPRPMVLRMLSLLKLDDRVEIED